MQVFIKLKIEKYEEKGQIYFVATSDDVQGLVAEGSTIAKVVEIAEDVAKTLLEIQQEIGENLTLVDIPNQFQYPLIVEV